MKVNVIQVKKHYIAKDGKDRIAFNYYLQLDNGKRVPVNPVVVYEKDKNGISTQKLIYDGKSDLSLIADLVEYKE